MNFIKLCILFPIAVTACNLSQDLGSGDRKTTDGETSDITTDASSSDETAANEAGAGDTTNSETAVMDVPGPDDGLGPRPPGIANKCGEGTFSQADVGNACVYPPKDTFWDLGTWPSTTVDGGTQPAASQCNAATSDGGRWEVWCSPEAVYVWARFDNVRKNTVADKCDYMEVAANFQLHDSMRGKGSDGYIRSQTASKPSAFSPPLDSTPMTLIAEGGWEANVPTGSGRVYLVWNPVKVSDGCGVSAPAVVSVIPVHWDSGAK